MPRMYARWQCVRIDVNQLTCTLQDAEKAPYVPWYKGGFKGVRIDKAIDYHKKTVREAFRYNPYNIGAKWYLFIMIAQLAFLFGNLTIGYADAKEKQSKKGEPGWHTWHPWLALIKGWLASFVILWIFPLFLFPPLIANAKEQFTAHGLPLHD